MVHSSRRPQAWVSWSSGKDSALALEETMAAGEVEVVGLLTTVNAEAERVAMHGVRRSLLEAQADALGLALQVVELPWPCPNEVYEQRMAEATGRAADAGVEAMVFGDLFLEDVRRYRETALRDSGIRPLFPLWGRRTDEVAQALLTGGYRAVVTCVDTTQAPREIIGCWFDEELLAGLPDGVDPCGENGEFHTVVLEAPAFSRALEVTIGETVQRGDFVFADVVPVESTGSA